MEKIEDILKELEEEKKIEKEPFVLGDKFLDNQGNIVTNVLNRGQKVTLLFFSGGYCPPCRSFAPVLKEFYEQANIIEKNLEIIYVPFDQTNDQYEKSTKDFPWISIPFKDARSKKYAENFQVKGVPVVIVLTKNLKSIDSNAKLQILDCIKTQSDPDILIHQWQTESQIKDLTF